MEVDGKRKQLEIDFEKDVDKSIIELKKIHPRLASDFELLSIKNKGHYELSKKLIKRVTEGFIKLLEIGHKDLSIEAIVVKEKYKSLFNEKDINFCKKKIRNKIIINSSDELVNYINLITICV